MTASTRPCCIGSYCLEPQITQSQEGKEVSPRAQEPRNGSGAACAQSRQSGTGGGGQLHWGQRNGLLSPGSKA